MGCRVAVTPGGRGAVLWGRARRDGSVTTRLCSSAGTAAPFNLLPPFKPRNVQIKIFNAYFYFRPSGYLYLFLWFLTLFGGRGVALQLPRLLSASGRGRVRCSPASSRGRRHAATGPMAGMGRKRGKKGLCSGTAGPGPRYSAVCGCGVPGEGCARRGTAAGCVRAGQGGVQQGGGFLSFMCFLGGCQAPAWQNSL